MSDEKKKPLIDIKSAVDRHATYKTLDELKARGRNRVRVLKLEQFQQLINRAISNVIQSTAFELAEKEKAHLVEESNKEFKRLFKERQDELRDLHQKDEQILDLKRRIDSIQTDLGSEKSKREASDGALRQARENYETSARRLEDDLAARQTEVAKIRDASTRAERDLDRQRTEREVLESALAEARGKLDDLSHEFDTKLLEKDAALSKLRDDVRRAEHRVDEEKARTDGLETTLSDTRERSSRIAAAAEDSDRRTMELEAEVARLKSELDDLQESRESFEKRMLDDLAALRASEQALHTDIERERERSHDLQSSLERERERGVESAREVDASARRHDDESYELRREQERARHDLDKERTQREAIEERLTAAKEQLDEARRSAHDLEETARRSGERVSNTVEELEAALATRDAELEDALELATTLESRLTGRQDLAKRIKELEAQLLGRDDELLEARERVAALADRNRDLETRLESTETREREAIEEASHQRARAEGLTTGTDEKNERISQLEREIARVGTMKSDREDEDSSVRAQLDRLADELRVEREERRRSMAQIIDQNDRQASMVDDLRELRTNLEAKLGEGGDQLADISSRIEAVAPLLEDVRAIKKSIEEGGGGIGGDAEKLMESIQGTVSLGIERIKGDLTDQIESIRRRDTKEQVAKQVQSAEVALDRLFNIDNEIESNVNKVNMRTSRTGGILGNLEKLRRLRGGAATGSKEKS